MLTDFGIRKVRENASILKNHVRPRDFTTKRTQKIYIFLRYKR